MDLADFMEPKDHQPPDWLQRLSSSERRGYLYRSIYGLVSGLSFLHREKDGTITAHHDLKPKNILVFGQELKIADLGRSHLRPLAQGSETQTIHLGTYAYQPPEYWKDDGTEAKLKHGRAFDIWSMGCIIVELATLIVYGWKYDMLTVFRCRRRDNLYKESSNVADRHRAKHHKRDDSFHNNWNVVKEWIDQLKGDDRSPKLKETLDVALQMMNHKRDDRLYAWEAELNLYNIQQRDDDRVKRLEIGSLCVQSPSPQRKMLNGTETPLHRAAQKGDLDRIRQLFETGWSMYIQDHKGLTAWDVLGRREEVDFLRGRLAPNTPDNAVNEEQGQELLQAATSGDVERVRNLVAQGVDVMFVDQGNQSALHVAVIHDRIPVAECLLQAKAKELLRLKDTRWGDTPLHRAASWNNATMIEKLLTCSPDIEDQQDGGNTALFNAVECGSVEAVEAVDVLLKHGAQVFTQKRNIRATPLHSAARNGRLRILKRLLEAPDAKKCLEHKNTCGDTALWVAMFHRHPECADILLNQGASLHVANNYGDNVVHQAVLKSEYDFLKRNIHRFSREDFEHRNGSNRTPLVIAREQGKQNFVQLLTDQLHRDSGARAS